MVVQSEVSQKKKKKNNQRCILTYVHGISKDGTDEPICRTGIKTQPQRTKYGGKGGKAVGGMHWETGIDLYT